MPQLAPEAEFSLAARGPDAGAFAWAPDGKRIAVLAPMLRHATLYEAASGQELATIDDLAGGGHSIEFDATGRVIVAPRRAANAAVSLWNPASGTDTAVPGPSDAGGGSALNQLVGFSLDRARARAVGIHRARAGRGFALRLALYDATSWRLVVSLGTIASQVAVSPDGARAALIGQDGQVEIVDLARGATERRIAANHNPVRQLAWSGDGRRLLTGTLADGFGRDRRSGGCGRLHDDDVLQLWEADSGRRIAAVSAAETGGGVRALDGSGDGARFAAATCDGAVRLLDGATLQPVATLAEGLRGRGAVLRFSPDGKRLGLLDQGRLTITLFRLPRAGG